MAISAAMILAAVLIYDHKKPSCVDAQTCVNVFSSFQVQSATCGCNSVGCSTSCFVGAQPNQFCFLSQVRVGDMGGGGDQAGCAIGGTGVTASASSDGRPISCTITCVNFL